MSEWWTYTLSDFLMFSPQVYYRLFELHNRALWPAQLLTIGVGFAILYLVLRRQGGGDRGIAAMLGALWIGLAWAFFWERYPTINWAAAYVAPFIALEGLLLIGLGAIGGRPIFISRAFSIPIESEWGSSSLFCRIFSTQTGIHFAGKCSRRGPSALAGLGLFAFALACYPFLAPLMGRPWLSGEIFGIAPDPTALATLALLALAEGRTRWVAMLIPALWCAVSALTLWTMGAGDFFLPIAGALAAIGIAFARRR